MQGHHQLIALRQSGVKPSIVFVNDYPCRTDWQQHMDNPTVSVFDTPLENIDFRFATGIRVSITAANAGRAQFLFDKAIEAGAEVVACCSSNFTKVYHKDTGVVNG